MLGLGGVLAVAVAMPAAFAQDDGAAIAGSYEVKFDEVQNSCQDTGIVLRKSTIELSKGARKRLDVTVPMVPIMKGVASKGGKFKAKAQKGPTAIQGVDGKFSVSGRVSDGVIQMVFIAEYFQGEKALCTQSWNASGVQK
jgi:hypothetical protein